MSIRNIGFTVIYNYPKPRQEWIGGKFTMHHEKNEEAWVELFNDLVFVVLLTKLGLLLEECIQSVFLYFKVAVIFWLMCLSRQAIDEYANRFYCHDLFHKIMYFVFSSGIFIQVMNINVVLKEESEDSASHRYLSSSSSKVVHANMYECYNSHLFAAGFAVGVLITRLSLILNYLTVMYHHKNARLQFSFDLGRWVSTVVIMIIIIIINNTGSSSDELNTVLLGIAVLIELSTWLISRSLFRQYFKFPIDLDLMQSRWGVWVMIVVGEAIIQMLYKTVYAKHLYNTYIFTLAAFALMFSLAMQYYDACQVEWFEHALTRSALQGVSWIWLHVPMTLQLFRVGTSFNICLTCMLEDLPVPDTTTWIISTSLGVTTAILTLIRITNLSFSAVTSRQWLTFVFRLLLSGMQVSVAAWDIHDPIYIILIHTAISILLFNCIDVTHDIDIVKAKVLAKKLREENAMKSLRKIPRQWSTLNFVSSKGLDTQKSIGDPIAEEREGDGDGDGDGDGPSVSDAPTTNRTFTGKESGKAIKSTKTPRKTDSGKARDVEKSVKFLLSSKDPGDVEAQLALQEDEEAVVTDYIDLEEIAKRRLMKVQSEYDGFVFKIVHDEDLLSEHREQNVPSFRMPSLRKSFGASMQKVLPDIMSSRKGNYEADEVGSDDIEAKKVLGEGIPRVKPESQKSGSYLHFLLPSRKDSQQALELSVVE